MQFSRRASCCRLVEKDEGEKILMAILLSGQRIGYPVCCSVLQHPGIKNKNDLFIRKGVSQQTLEPMTWFVERLCRTRGFRVVGDERFNA